VTATPRRGSDGLLHTSSDHVTKAAVRYGSAPAVPVRLEPGLRRLYVATSGAGPDVRVTDLDPGAVVCLGRVVVGNAGAVP
jgi:hypothetical protein